jgi:hypothetical protein
MSKMISHAVLSIAGFVVLLVPPIIVSTLLIKWVDILLSLLIA